MRGTDYLLFIRLQGIKNATFQFVECFGSWKLF